jgi:lysozyme family protein
MYLDQYDSPKAAGHEAYYDEELRKLVMQFYKEEFWDKMRLDDIASQRIADEIFIFGVNAGTKRAIELAQLVVGIDHDGLIGPKTLAALNSYDENKFDIEFDKAENEYYEKLASVRPALHIYLKGWRNRANAV